VIGVNAFLLVLFAGPFSSAVMLYAGALLIGLGLGLFSVGTLIEAMALAKSETAGLALGAWGAVQATCAGGGIALGGLIRDGIAWIAASDTSATIATRASGYISVYIIEILLLIAGLAAIGPLVGHSRMSSIESRNKSDQPFGLQEFPT
jgi:BCD family chlorophyll transporter-like MFS transporter